MSDTRMWRIVFTDGDSTWEAQCSGTRQNAEEHARSLCFNAWTRWMISPLAESSLATALPTSGERP